MKKTADEKSGRTLWWWVAAGFLFLGTLWAAMFVVARQVNVQSVPIETKGARP